MKNHINWSTLRGLCIVALVSGIVLAFCTNLSLPSDHDQVAKAGRIVCLIHTGNYFNTTFEPVFYHDLIYPLYYMISSLFCSCLPLNVYGSMNVLSVLFGITCFVALVQRHSMILGLLIWKRLQLCDAF
jgi:hypothetical protein